LCLTVLENTEFTNSQRY